MVLSESGGSSVTDGGGGVGVLGSYCKGTRSYVFILEDQLFTSIELLMI